MRISDWSSDVCSSDLSGPLLDRVDLQIALPPAEPGWVDLPEGEPSAAVRQRVLDCRARQWRRQEITNARLGPDEIRSEERRVGQGCVSQCRSRGSQYN